MSVLTAVNIWQYLCSLRLYTTRSSDKGARWGVKLHIRRGIISLHLPLSCLHFRRLKETRYIDSQTQKSQKQHPLVSVFFFSDLQWEGEWLRNLCTTWINRIWQVDDEKQGRWSLQHHRLSFSFAGSDSWTAPWLTLRFPGMWSKCHVIHLQRCLVDWRICVAIGVVGEPSPCSSRLPMML